jgi:hypothetical protein
MGLIQPRQLEVPASPPPASGAPVGAGAALGGGTDETRASDETPVLMLIPLYEFNSKNRNKQPMANAITATNNIAV